MITQTLQLNLVPKGISPRLYVTQYDYDSRTLTFEIYNGSNRFTLTSGTTAKIQGTKPDRHGFSYNAEVDTTNNVITADITQQMTAVDGDVVVEIVLIKNNKRIGTLNFVMVVQPAGLNDDTDTSDSDLPDIIAEATEQMLTAEAYAKGTRNGTTVTSGQTGYHDNSKYYKEQAATQASNASTSATNANTNALKAEGYAVGKQNGTTQTSGTYYHNNAQYYKEQAASSATTASTKAGEASSSANTASQKASAANTSAQTASDKALVAEGYAKGTQNGTPVGSTSPYYHNNAEYFKNLANPTVAANVSFNNSGTDMSSTNVQDGIVENRTSIQNLSNSVTKNGAKNTLPLTLAQLKSCNTDGTWTVGASTATYVISNVTFTVAFDSNEFVTGISVTGTNSTGSRIKFYLIAKNTQASIDFYNFIAKNLGNIVYSLDKSPTETKMSSAIEVYNNGTWKRGIDITGSNVSRVIDLTISDCNQASATLFFDNGAVGTGVQAKPMVSFKSMYDVDPTYEPWAMTNQQLTQDKVGMDLLGEVGAVNHCQNLITTQIVKGVTVTVNDDYSITCTGSIDANTTNGLYAQAYMTVKVPKGTYKYSTSADGKSGIGNENLFICLDKVNGTSNWYRDYQNNYITVTTESYIRLSVGIKNSTNTAIPVNITFYPMIAPVSYTGPYVPFAKSNKELTEDVAKLTIKTATFSANTGTNGIVASGIPEAKAPKCIPISVSFTSTAPPPCVGFEYNNSYGAWYIRCKNWDGSLKLNADVAGTISYIDLN